MSAYNGKLYVFEDQPRWIQQQVGQYGNLRLGHEFLVCRPNLPVACNYSVAVTYGDKILVFGGWDQAEDNMDRVWNSIQF